MEDSPDLLDGSSDLAADDSSDLELSECSLMRLVIAEKSED